GEPGAEVARSEGVDPDVVASPLRGEFPCEAEHSGFRGDVGGLAVWAGGDQAVDGGNVDDAARCAGGDHGSGRQARQDEGGVEVDLDHPPEVGGVFVDGLGGGVGDSGVVDKHADRADGGCGVDDRLQVGVVDDVAAAGDDPGNLSGE